MTKHVVHSTNFCLLKFSARMAEKQKWVLEIDSTRIMNFNQSA